MTDPDAQPSTNKTQDSKKILACRKVEDNVF